MGDSAKAKNAWSNTSFHTNLLIGGISSCLHSRSVNVNCAMCKDSR